VPVRFWVGVTDNTWFSNLQAKRLDEVNFWQPSARPLFANAPVGMPFLFKLKRPHNHIAGGGFFMLQTTLPLRLAWEIFGTGNGADTFTDFAAMIGPLMAGRTSSEIGCTLLSNPVFLPREAWLADVPGWSSNIVRGKHFETMEPDGAAIWRQLGPVLAARSQPVPADDAGATRESPTEGYGSGQLVKPRLGQGGFRIRVTEAYDRRCAITGESTLIALEAAHIVPYVMEQRHEVTNGLLLRADFHRLFDAGLVAVDPDYRVRVSPRIREMYYNGKAYYRLDRQPLSQVPTVEADKPDRDRLGWHFKNCFQA
jgi:putative restriction endonuclease